MAVAGGAAVATAESAEQARHKNMLTPPLAYKNTTKKGDTLYNTDLFLADNGFFFMNQYAHKEHSKQNVHEPYSTWGHWNQVKNGHGVELLTADNKTIQGHLKSEDDKKSLILDTIPNVDLGAAAFELIVSSELTSKPVDLIGTITPKDGHFFFKPTHSDTSFKLVGFDKQIKKMETFLHGKKDITTKIIATYHSPSELNLVDIFEPTKEYTDKANSATVATAQEHIQNTYWKLVEVNGNRNIILSSDEPQVTFNTAEINGTNGEGTGFDGCNGFFFNWELSGDKKLKITLGGSTLRMCHEAGIDKQSQELMQALSQTDSYTIKGSVLELKHDDKVSAKFETNPL